jgi:ankyrin repeat protein
VAHYLVVYGGANLKEKTSKEGLTVLHMAAKTCNAHMVNSLLKLGADTTECNSDGHTPMEYAKLQRKFCSPGRFKDEYEFISRDSMALVMLADVIDLLSPSPSMALNSAEIDWSE